MANLLGDCWGRDASGGFVEPDWAVAPACRRDAGATAGPEDGPPHGTRRHGRRGDRAGDTGPGRGGAMPRL